MNIFRPIESDQKRRDADISRNKNYIQQKKLILRIDDELEKFFFPFLLFIVYHFKLTWLHANHRRGRLHCHHSNSMRGTFYQNKKKHHRHNKKIQIASSRKQ